MRQYITPLFIQAWWEYLFGDEHQSAYVLNQALNIYFQGLPFQEEGLLN